MGEKTKSVLTAFLRWWFVLPIAYGVLIIMLVFDVIEHEETTTTRVLCMMGCLALFAAQVVYLLLALFRRKWLMSLGIFVGLVINAILTFFCLIGLAAGQFRPPKGGDDFDVADTLALDSIELVYSDEETEVVDSIN